MSRQFDPPGLECRTVRAVNKFWASILVLPVTSLTLACGSGSNGNRQLQSIALTAVANGQQIQFVATGTFSAAPITVSPLPVFWSFAPPPAEYTLTTEPFTFQCDFVGTYPMPLIAWAPPDSNAPSSGPLSTATMIRASGSITCP
jgi:hypothetical protein